MHARTRNIIVIFAMLVLGACGGLPREMRNRIASENDKLKQAERQVARSEETVRADLKQAPALFQGASVAAEWPAELRAARRELDAAKNDARQLAELSRRGRKDANVRAEQLLAEERNLREGAVRKAEAVDSAAAKWVGFERNLPYYLGAMKREYETVRATDLNSTAQAVAKAEQDWPAKKPDLDSRLAALKTIPVTAEAKWTATEQARRDAAAGKASATEVATLIETDDALSRAANELPKKAGELRGMSGQLYDAWDKVLTDLDVSHYGGDNIYREKVKTVRTHFTDVAAKKTEVSSDETWVDVPEPTYRAVENDLGMAIAHKDAGHFDSEAQTTAQPPGFAYVAPPSQGSNQYGYWTHGGNGSFWTFLPEYLLMRQLLWGHDYRPIVVDEYNAYRTAQRSGQTYYGKDTPTSAPKYGSHGTFTASRYGNSRYVQSGGFKGSGYANGGASAASRYGSSHAESPSGARSNDSAGHRFGAGSPSPSSGQRFGSSRPSRSSGRSFGRRR
jgi:hypothetical protein